MGKSDVVETGVDNLIRLVESKGKISVPDVAKELGVKQKTVENWVDFLVEEEKIGVEYKFTTPYIFMKKDEKDADSLSISKEEMEKLGGKVPENKDMIKVKKGNVRESEIVSEDDLRNDSDDDFTDMFHKKEEKKELSPVEKVRYLFSQIEGQLQNNDVEKAHQLYSDVKTILSSLPNTEETEFLNRRMIEINEKFLSSIGVLSKELESQSKQIDFIIQKGNKALEQENIDSAKQTYAQLLSIYQKIPSIFMEQKKLLYNNIFEFYKSLITKEYSNSLKIIKDGDKKIDAIIQEVENHLENNDIDEANAVFGKINDIYGSLPHGFLQQKLHIHTKILKLYEELKISNKFRELHSKLAKLNSKVAKTYEPKVSSQHDKDEQNFVSGEKHPTPQPSDSVPNLPDYNNKEDTLKKDSSPFPAKDDQISKEKENPGLQVQSTQPSATKNLGGTTENSSTADNPMQTSSASDEKASQNDAPSNNFNSKDQDFHEKTFEPKMPDEIMSQETAQQTTGNDANPSARSDVSDMKKSDVSDMDKQPRPSQEPVSEPSQQSFSQTFKQTPVQQQTGNQSENASGGFQQADLSSEMQQHQQHVPEQASPQQANPQQDPSSHNQGPRAGTENKLAQKKTLDENELFDKAMKYYKTKRYEESKAIFDQILTHDPSNARAKEMSALISNLMRSSGNNTKSLLVKAISSASVGKFEEAQNTLNEILRSDPDNEDAKKILATIQHA